jgi:hypothetical protein
MHLGINELLNPCHFTHLIAMDIDKLQNPIVLMVRIF